MREFKFRLWDKKYEMFDYNFSPDVFIGTDGVVFEKDERTFGMEFYTVYEKTDNYIISQYTGIKDKNGKEIYEGDIVKRIFSKHSDYIGEVVFEDVTYFIKKDNGEDGAEYSFLANQHDFETEIIGNIYENPELLQ